MGETGVNAHMAAVVVAILRVVGGLVAIVLIKKLPRGRLAMATMTLMSLSMAILGAVLYMKDKGADGTVLRAVPVLLCWFICSALELALVHFSGFFLESFFHLTT